MNKNSIQVYNFGVSFTPRLYLHQMALDLDKCIESIRKCELLTENQMRQLCRMVILFSYCVLLCKLSLHRLLIFWLKSRTLLMCLRQWLYVETFMVNSMICWNFFQLTAKLILQDIYFWAITWIEGNTALNA